MFALYTSDNTTYIMDSRERFFVTNYSLYGEASAKRCGYSKKEVQAIKEKYKEKGIYMLPVRKMVENKMPAQKGSRATSNDYSSIAFAIACLDYDDQNRLIEFSKNVPNTPVLINEAITLELMRLGKALKEEQNRGIILDSVSEIMRDYTKMIEAKKNIDDGQEIHVNVNDSVTGWLNELERNNHLDIDAVDYDFDKEQRKEKIKELRKEEFSDLLNDME